jgi:peptidoglycan/LPS O-acetylase OafA/YrhL
MVLSFFFFSKKNLILRIKRLIVPLVFWSIIGFTIHPMQVNLTNIAIQLFTGHVVNTPLYFLVLLVWYTIMVWIMDDLDRSWKISGYLIILISAFYLEYSGINFKIFYPMISVFEKSYGRFVELIKYVPLGLLFSYIYKKMDKKYLIFISILFFILFFLSLNLNQPKDFHYSGLRLFFIVSAVFSLVLWLSQFIVKRNISLMISFIGKYSFGVYLSHYLILEVLVRNFPNLKLFINNNQFFFLIIFTPFVYLFCLTLDLLSIRKISLVFK